MKRKSALAALILFLFSLCSVAAWPQSIKYVVQGKAARAGEPIAKAEVVVTNSGTGRSFKTKTDSNGNFAFAGITPGEYDFVLNSPSGEKLMQLHRTVAAADSEAEIIVLLDPSAPENKGAASAPAGKPPKMSKEQIKAEEGKVAAINALITQAEAARRAQNWPEAEKDLQQVLSEDPNTTRWELYRVLGDCLSRDNKLDDAVKTWQKGIEVAQAVAAGTAPPDLRNPNPDTGRAKAGAAQMLGAIGNVYVKQGKTDDAMVAFKKSAESDPNPAVAWYNLCAIQYNSGKYDDAAASCDKSIAANPAKAEAWYFKGASLKNAGKPGATEAINKYLELEPTGPYAAAAKSLLPK
jgi:tetratricopeptide (TPR) repeat protein